MHVPPTCTSPLYALATSSKAAAMTVSSAMLSRNTWFGVWGLGFGVLDGSWLNRENIVSSLVWVSVCQGFVAAPSFLKSVSVEPSSHTGTTITKLHHIKLASRAFERHHPSSLSHQSHQTHAPSLKPSDPRATRAMGRDGVVITRTA